MMLTSSPFFRFPSGLHLCGLINIQSEELTFHLPRWMKQNSEQSALQMYQWSTFKCTSYVRWEMTCVSSEGWSTSSPEPTASAAWSQAIFWKGRTPFLRKFRESNLSSQFWCTTEWSKLCFLGFLAHWFMSSSPAHVCRLRCSMPVLLHIVFKWYNKRKVLSKLQGFQCNTRVEAGMVMGCYCHNEGRCQIFSLAQSCNRSWWLWVSKHLKFWKLCPAEWLRSP